MAMQTIHNHGIQSGNPLVILQVFLNIRKGTKFNRIDNLDVSVFLAGTGSVIKLRKLK